MTIDVQISVAELSVFWSPRLRRRIKNGRVSRLGLNLIQGTEKFDSDCNSDLNIDFDSETLLFKNYFLPSFDWTLDMRTPFDMIRITVKIMAFIIACFSLFTMQLKLFPSCGFSRKWFILALSDDGKNL